MDEMCNVFVRLLYSKRQFFISHSAVTNGIKTTDGHYMFHPIISDLIGDNVASQCIIPFRNLPNINAHTHSHTHILHMFELQNVSYFDGFSNPIAMCHPVLVMWDGT